MEKQVYWIIGIVALILLVSSGIIKLPFQTAAIYTGSGGVSGNGCSSVVIGLSGAPVEFTDFKVGFRVNDGINHQGASFKFNNQPITVTSTGGGGTFDAGTIGSTQDLSPIINSMLVVNSNGELNELTFPLCVTFNAPTPQTFIEFQAPSYTTVPMSPNKYCSDGIHQAGSAVGFEKDLEAQVDCGNTCVLTNTTETCNNLDDNRNCLVDEGIACTASNLVQPSPGFDIINTTIVNVDGQQVVVVREQQVVTQVERTVVYDSPSTSFEETKTKVGEELFIGGLSPTMFYIFAGIFILLVIIAIIRK